MVRRPRERQKGLPTHPCLSPRRRQRLRLVERERELLRDSGQRRALLSTCSGIVHGGGYGMGTGHKLAGVTVVALCTTDPWRYHNVELINYMRVVMNTFRLVRGAPFPLKQKKPRPNLAAPSACKAKP